MKAGGGHAKGADFERSVCKYLSHWWTDGAREDIFWRTPQSGGRATRRKQKGLATANHYGDILATDLIGTPLLKFMILELKCGYGSASIMDLIDSGIKSLWRRWIDSAERVREEAGSRVWGLIVHRPGKKTVICYPRLLRLLLGGDMKRSMLIFHGEGESGGIEMTRLDDFIETIRPAQIIDLMRMRLSELREHLQSGKSDAEKSCD